MLSISVTLTNFISHRTLMKVMTTLIPQTSTSMETSEKQTKKEEEKKPAINVLINLNKYKTNLRALFMITCPWDFSCMFLVMMSSVH